ncbi:MAG: hypothetical protein ACRD96_13540 [Bryobacteraceae bacterium]
MRADGGGKKKLIVAFHFEQSDQAGWKCDQCRNAGLEMKRRCGWAPGAGETPARVVWAKGRASADRCPKSVITAQSLDWIERFVVWRRLGALYPEPLGAKDIEAFLVLEQEMTTEGSHG